MDKYATCTGAKIVVNLLTDQQAQLEVLDLLLFEYRRFVSVSLVNVFFLHLNNRDLDFSSSFYSGVLLVSRSMVTNMTMDQNLFSSVRLPSIPQEPPPRSEPPTWRKSNLPPEPETEIEEEDFKLLPDSPIAAEPYPYPSPEPPSPLIVEPNITIRPVKR